MFFFLKENAYQMLIEITTKEKDPHNFVIPYAEFHLGKAFFQGYGVPQSEQQAERLYQYYINHHTFMYI